MTATPVQTTLEERVLEWTEQLCESLAENYKRYHRRMIEANSSYFNADGDKELSEYAQKQIDALDNGTAKLMKFRIENGRNRPSGSNKIVNGFMNWFILVAILWSLVWAMLP